MSKENSAIKTLEYLGYTYHGGEQWKPPLGKRPDCLDMAPAEQQENSKLFDLLIDEMLEHSYQGSHDSAEKVANEIRRMYKAALREALAEQPAQPASEADINFFRSLSMNAFGYREMSKTLAQEIIWLAQSSTPIEGKPNWVMVTQESMERARKFAESDFKNKMDWRDERLFAADEYFLKRFFAVPEQPAQQEPLMDERLLELLMGVDPEAQRIPLYLMRFIRAIEAAHGITKGNT